MSTPYSDVINASTIKFDDYQMNKLKVEKPDNWMLRMEGFLLNGLPLFNKCRKDLYDRDEDLKQFNADLTGIEIDILSDCIRIMWLERTLNDKLNLNSMIQDKNSAKRVNEPAMLSANRINISQEIESLNRKISDYCMSDYIEVMSQ